MKKKVNTSEIMSELQGSVFFPSKPQEPEQQHEITSQEPRNPSSQHPRNPGTQEDGKVASQEPAKTGSQEFGKRADYPQQTFNIHPDVIDMLEDMKRDLRR